jgi:hypothetical protein
MADGFCKSGFTAESSSFGYQGRLINAGKPANGLFDLSSDYDVNAGRYVSVGANLSDLEFNPRSAWSQLPRNRRSKRDPMAQME